MHDNVAEWVLDSYDKDFYKEEIVYNPISLLSTASGHKS
jgi:hypothetical protein